MQLYLFDTTLRDGQQNKKFQFSDERRLQIAHALQDAGVHIIEVAYPANQPEQIPSSQVIAKQIKQASICCIARMEQKQVDLAMEVLQYAQYPRLHVYLDAKYNQASVEEAQNIAQGCKKFIRQARNNVGQLEFSLMDISRVSTSVMLQYIRAAVDGGAGTINLSDTLGIAQPQELETILTLICEEIPQCQNITLSLHAHNHEGRALENALHAVQHGVQQIEGTIGGIGPAGGNMDLIAFMQALLKSDVSVDHNIKMDKLLPIAQLIV